MCGSVSTALINANDCAFWLRPSGTINNSNNCLNFPMDTVGPPYPLDWYLWVLHVLIGSTVHGLQLIESADVGPMDVQPEGTQGR